MSLGLANVEITDNLDKTEVRLGHTVDCNG